MILELSTFGYYYIYIFVLVMFVANILNIVNIGKTIVRKAWVAVIDIFIVTILLLVLTGVI